MELPASDVLITYDLEKKNKLVISYRSMRSAEFKTDLPSQVDSKPKRGIIIQTDNKTFLISDLISIDEIAEMMCLQHFKDMSFVKYTGESK